MNRAAHALFVLRTHERLAHVGTPSDGPAARRGRRATRAAWKAVESCASDIDARNAPNAWAAVPSAR